MRTLTDQPAYDAACQGDRRNIANDSPVSR